MDEIIELIKQHGTDEQVAFLKQREQRFIRLKAQNFVYMTRNQEQPIINIYYDKPKEPKE